jgi:ComF family protein
MEGAIAEKSGSFQFWKNLWGGAVDFLTPPKCLGCLAPVTTGASLCVTCWQKLAFLDEPVCAVLGTPFEFDQGDGALSPAAIADPPPWDGARAAVAFNDTAQHMIHLLKYQDTHEAGIAMARMMGLAGRSLIAQADVLVPVPLHRFRLWQRRFNQAAVLGHRIGAQGEKPVHCNVLLRLRRTRQQVGLNAEERQRNVRKAFAVSPEKQPVIDGKSVLLVDDVRTTGATLAACTLALKAAGAAKVNVLTFALVLEPARLHIEV